MKIVRLKGFNENPSEMRKKAEEVLLSRYNIIFNAFEDTSKCGKVHIHDRYSSYYMNDSKWCGYVTITSKISLKAKDFK